MKIYLKLPSGLNLPFVFPGGSTAGHWKPSNYKVSDLTEQIASWRDYNDDIPEHFELNFNDTLLDEPDKKVVDYDVVAESTIQVVATGQEAGGRKRRRKSKKRKSKKRKSKKKKTRRRRTRR
jgi:hypothetical protein